jgi:hypothetical protein
MSYAVTICCEANPKYFLAANANGTVAELALGKSNDPRQIWIKDDKWGIEIQDTEDRPAFALVNKATKCALKHGDQSLDQVFMGDYDNDSAEDSALWTFSANVGGGYHAIRNAKNHTLNLDVKGGKMESGNHVILFPWKNGMESGTSNQKWKAEIVHA